MKKLRTGTPPRIDLRRFTYEANPDWSDTDVPADETNVTFYEDGTYCAMNRTDYITGDDRYTLSIGVFEVRCISRNRKFQAIR